VTAADTRLDQAVALHQAGRLAEAASLYRAVIADHPDDADAHNLLGAAELALGRPEAALGLLDRAVALNPGDERYYLNRANALRTLGQFAAALADLRQATERRADYLPAWMAQGQILAHLRRPAEAAAAFDRVLALKPDLAVAWHYRGLAHGARGDAAAALADFERALALTPDAAETRKARALALVTLGRHEAALAEFETLVSLRPDDAAAHKDRGDVLARLNRHAEAVAAFDRALALNPALAEAHNGRGLALLALHRVGEALAAFDRALDIAPGLAEARYNRGQALGELGRHAEAADCFSRLIAEGREVPFLPGHRLAARLRCCDWTDYEAETARIAAAVDAGEPADTPFNFLVHSASPARQLRVARAFVAAACPPQPPVPRPRRAPRTRIRLAYLSADFNNHATALLAGRLFERHDRSAFEVVGLSFSADDGSAAYRELPRAFDRFLDVRALSDRDVAAWMAAEEIDIAVDLKGHTANSRPGILAFRPAPVQAQFLGFPATMGADYIDYLIADRHVVPDAHRADYAEKVVRLPGSYQVNDSLRPRPASAPPRAAHGLPERGVVFCSFNSAFKITPAVFEVWMRLLRAVAGSVLWLLHPGAAAEANLRREAAARGVDPARLVFAPRTALAPHLERHLLADLFLDTLPCNAHTTASDALWVGVPVLTCMGETFTGRVCGGLLHTLGLPELVTTTLADYEALALRIARSPALLAELKAKVAAGRTASPLFDVDRFRANLERAYRAMWQRHAEGLPPDHIDVTAA
jgi:predicted O-linked N-acetylglucosamine transferase (SPINDLY family)